MNEKTMTEKYDEAVKHIHECVVSELTEEEEKWYDLFCKFQRVYEREQALCQCAFQSLLKEEARVCEEFLNERKEAESKLRDNSDSHS